MDDILQHLPDERATQRLLNVLDKLDKFVTQQKKGMRQADSAEAKALRQENMTLKFRQAKARDKLDKLLERLPGLFPELTESKNAKEAA